MKLSTVITVSFFALYAMQKPAWENANLNTTLPITESLSPDTTRKPIVTLEKTALNTMQVLYINDSVNRNELSRVFERCYGELFAFAGNNHLKPGKVMAFYHTYTDPIELEVAIEVDQIPIRLTGRIKSKILDGGEVIIAHYTGPYEQLEMPYTTITKWLKDNNRIAKGLPFEAYLNDPGSVKDKYELRTDIYQFLSN